ncbi:50S ribosomal protein L11 methyltransferase, partial [Anaerosalibacter bizertensis]|nr:50S ribosomal protein L11 methyltransferase [Anaerosalibacter bizertensis]
KKEDEIIVELDPGMAFGTGTHETTSMCIRQLENHVKKDDKVFDIGCGSGILSIVAAKLGASKVIGVDLDELPVKVSKENIVLNNVQDIVDIRRGNLLNVVDERADLIVSNIIAEIIVDLIKDIKGYLNSGGIFISSGIILEKLPLVEEALKEEGFSILEVSKMKDWACVVAQLEMEE